MWLDIEWYKIKNCELLYSPNSYTHKFAALILSNYSGNIYYIKLVKVETLIFYKIIMIIIVLLLIIMLFGGVHYVGIYIMCKKVELLLSILACS